jgi:hypothetical protein
MTYEQMTYEQMTLWINYVWGIPDGLIREIEALTWGK